MKFLITTLLLFTTTFSSYADLRRQDGGDIPVGTTISSAAVSCPVGFLKNDGSAISRSTYPKLFTTIGTTYGVGDGLTTFNLPKYDWMIDANIGGGSPTLATSSTYTEITNATLDLVINTSTGSANAQIACASGTDSTGLTCSSNESVGVTFTNPFIGKFRACFTFAINISNGNNTHEIIETTPLSSAIVQEGNAKTNSYTSNGTMNARFPETNCSIFNFTNILRRTLRLEYEADIASSQLIIDRDPSTGQRDLHISITPVFPIGNCIKY